MNENIYRITKNSYNNIAIVYSEICESGDFLLPLLDTFISYLPANALVLDAGCGYGRDIAYFETKSIRVIGVDNSTELIKIAQSNVKSTILEQDIRFLTLEDNLFDGIWCNAVLHHLDDEGIDKAVHNFHRMLKDKGQLFISVTDSVTKSWDERYPNSKRFYNYIDMDKILFILKKNDFIVKSNSIINENISIPNVERSWIQIFLIK